MHMKENKKKERKKNYYENCVNEICLVLVILFLLVYKYCKTFEIYSKM